jgi:hypothetical protein
LKNKLFEIKLVLEYPNNGKLSVNVEKLINELPLGTKDDLGFGLRLP